MILKQRLGEQVAEVLALYANKDFDKSLSLALKLLKKNPDNLSLLINCGNIFHLKTNYQEALNYYRKGLALDPENDIVIQNISNSFYDSGDYKNAANYALLGLKKKYNPTLAGILGASFFEMEKYSSAIDILERKMHLEKKKMHPEISPWDEAYLIEAYLKTCQVEKAIPILENLVSKNISDESLHLNLGYAFYDYIRENGDVDSLKKIIQKWRENNPDSQNARHWSNAFLKQSGVSKAERGYVQKVFDVFAPEFEKLLSELDYQVPKFLEELCTEFLDKKLFRKYDILDAGCGTGWCGKFLKKYSRFARLDGVDLSSGMLQEARAKKIYGSLFCSDLIEFLQQHVQQYDVIFSADVLTYFGALDSFFDGCQKCLREKGLAFFSVSENQLDESDYVLHCSGRSLHKKSYVEKCFSEKGFQCLKSEKKVLRKEGGEPVWGYVYAIKKTF